MAVTLTQEDIDLIRSLFQQVRGGGGDGGGIVHREISRLEKRLIRLMKMATLPMSVGNMAFTGNLGGEVTVIAAPGAYVPVGNGTPAHPLYIANPDNVDFTVVGATAATQVLRFDGNDAKKLCIRGILSIQEETIGAVGIAMRLLQNGVLIPNTDIEGQTGGLITTAGNLVTEGLVNASPGDIFQIEVANLSDDNDLTVSSGILTVGTAS